MPTAPTPAFLAALASALPEERVTRDPSDLAEYGRDWTKVYAPAPSVVVFPKSADEVARVVKLCNEHDVALVPSGGRTGLAGGAVARDGEVVLSLAKMSAIEPVDLLGNTVRVQAGAVTEAVHKHCAEHGLTWPVDFASKGSSQVGGNLATNAGGVKVIKYGLTRQWVLGLQVVTAQGEVLELNGALEKNNTGADLRQLFIGSEGTLGIITAATLKLTRLPKRADVMLFAVPDVAGVLALFRAARTAPFQLSAYEFFTDKCLARVQRHRKARAPFEAPSGCYVLVETEDAEQSAVEQWAMESIEKGLATDGTIAQDASQRAELWSLREGISESLSGTGLPHKNDIALPVARLDAFCAELDSLFAHEYREFELCVFGHIGDGNLHVNVMKPDAMDKETFLRAAKGHDRSMFELVQKHRGSVSAEHGIGLLKREALGYTRTGEEMAMLRALKRALDPKGVLNPGKIFEGA